jgi:mannose-1-phosphate guanylyltransferase
MAVKFISNDEVKIVTKPWGYEKWIQPGSDVYPFVLKQLLLAKGNRTSLQVHQYKSESIIIQSGTGTLLTYDEFFDCAKFLAGGYTVDEIEHVKNNLRAIPLEPNVIFHTPPGTVHRMVANEDLYYIEASTQELDDVVRLQDDRNRDHGRIDSEHK